MIAERLTAQLLAGPPADSPEQVARRLLAVQAQDPRGARLAIRSRTRGLSAGDVDRALSADRTLVVSWLNRGTLHLLAREDYPWLHALTTPPLRRANSRRLAQEGVSPEAAARGVAAIERALTQEGPLTREQLRERIAAAGVRTEGQALVHVLMLSALEGLTVRGPMLGSSHAYVLVRDWLGTSPRVDREQALGELARRYLAGHGPAEDRDLARWAGLPLRDARAGLARVATELNEIPGGLLDLAGRVPAAELPPPRMLGSFDPLLLGWRSREELLADKERLITTNGIFRPFALVRGRAVASWTLNAGRIELHPFARLRAGERSALERDAEDVLRFLGRAPAPGSAAAPAGEGQA